MVQNKAVNLIHGPYLSVIEGEVLIVLRCLDVSRPVGPGLEPDEAAHVFLIIFHPTTFLAADAIIETAGDSCNEPLGLITPVWNLCSALVPGCCACRAVCQWFQPASGCVSCGLIL